MFFLISHFSCNVLTEAPAKVPERAFEVYSPGVLSPAPVKKSRKNITAPNVTAAGAALQAAGRVNAAKASRRVVRSDDDDEEEDSDVEVEVVKRTPKPVRQRAAKSYVQEDSEPESNEESSEYESE